MADEIVKEPNDRDGRPDPSRRTIAQLHREIALLKDLFRCEIAGEVKAIESRLQAIDMATKIFQEDLIRVPTAVDRAINDLRVLMEEKFRSALADRESLGKLKEEKFRSIQNQFLERDVLAEKISQQSEAATRAALQAAKEAVTEQNRSSALAIAKSETATDKRLADLGALVATATATLDGKIGDIKDRLVRIEGQALGQQGARTESHLGISTLISLVAVALTAIGLLIAFTARSGVVH